MPCDFLFTNMSAIAVMLIFWRSWILFFCGVLEKGREEMQEAPILDRNQVNEDGPNEDLL